MSSSNQFDALGTRMKKYEKRETDLRFMINSPIYVRLDGRGFSKFTKDMDRPYDERMSNLMVAVSKYLCKEFNALIAYTQSDEISLVLNNNEDNPAIFDGKIQKIISTIASSATAYFNAHFQSYFQVTPDTFARSLPTFDARAFNLSSFDEVVNCIYWRYLDCQKNAVSMAAHHHFDHKSLHKQNTSKMKDRLQVEANVCFEDYPDYFKYGTFVKTQSYAKVLEDGGTALRNIINTLPLDRPFNQYTHEERKSFIF